MHWLKFFINDKTQTVIGNIRPVPHNYSLPFRFFSGKRWCGFVGLWQWPLMGLLYVGDSFVGGNGASHPGCTVLSVFRSCSSNDSHERVWINQHNPLPLSLSFSSHTHTFLTQLSMPLTLHLTNVQNPPLQSAETLLTGSLWQAGHGQDRESVSEDEGRRRCRRHRRRKRRRGEPFHPQSALPSRNTPRR